MCTYILSGFFFIQPFQSPNLNLHNMLTLLSAVLFGQEWREKSKYRILNKWLFTPFTQTNHLQFFALPTRTKSWLLSNTHKIWQVKRRSYPTEFLSWFLYMKFSQNMKGVFWHRPRTLFQVNPQINKKTSEQNLVRK